MVRFAQHACSIASDKPGWWAWAGKSAEADTSCSGQGISHSSSCSGQGMPRSNTHLIPIVKSGPSSGPSSMQSEEADTSCSGQGISHSGSCSGQGMPRSSTHLIPIVKSGLSSMQSAEADTCDSTREMLFVCYSPNSARTERVLTDLVENWWSHTTAGRN